MILCFLMDDVGAITAVSRGTPADSNASRSHFGSTRGDQCLGRVHTSLDSSWECVMSVVILAKSVNTGNNWLTNICLIRTSADPHSRSLQ